MNGMLARSSRMAEVLRQTPTAAGSALESELRDLRKRLQDLDTRLNGDRSKQAPGEKHAPTIQSRLFSVELGIIGSTYGPTGTHRRQLELAQSEIDAIRPQLEEYEQAVALLIQRMVDAGAPWIEGERLSGVRR